MTTLVFFDDLAFAPQNPSVVPVAPPPTAFAQSLLSAEGEEELAAALEGLKGLGPAKVETEIRWEKSATFHDVFSPFPYSRTRYFLLFLYCQVRASKFCLSCQHLAVPNQEKAHN